MKEDLHREQGILLDGDVDDYVFRGSSRYHY